MIKKRSFVIPFRPLCPFFLFTKVYEHKRSAYILKTNKNLVTMNHSVAIVAILTIGLAFASIFAYIAQRLHLPAILGYLFAGFLIGPYSPGFVADLSIAEQLAEIGVILMLFGVGMHFKLEDLNSVKNLAIPGAAIQTLVATLLAILLVHLTGWPLEAGIIIGLSIGVASTVVLVRVLSDRKLLHTLEGHIAVGWLVVEDIFTVIILLLLPTFAVVVEGSSTTMLNIAGSIAFILGKFLVLALFMFTWGHRLVAYALTNIARLRSQELFTLTVLAVVFLIAVGSAYLFGTSMALGAFIAGMVIGKTSVRHQAAANALPLKDIFSVLFFLSVGMLFNPTGIMTHFPLFLGIISIILIAKPLVAYLITICFGYPIKVALTVAIALSQIGEFSFILAEEAMNLKLLPDDAFDILVACAMISISLNPLFFKLLDYFEDKIKRFQKDPELNLNAMVKQVQKEPKAIVIGYGPIGKDVALILKNAGYTPMIVEQNIDTVSKLEEKTSIIFGDAASSNILNDAHIFEAHHLIITIPNTEKVLEIIHSARQENPDIHIIARIQYIGEKHLMEEMNVDYICTEQEALKGFDARLKHLLKPVVIA